MKTLLIALSILIGSLASANENQCQCATVTKVCTTQQNGTQYDVFLSIYDLKGTMVSNVKLANGISLQDAINILDSRTCN